MSTELRNVLMNYSRKDGYEVSHFADAVCACGTGKFRLLLDDNEGAAVRICSDCSVEHPIGDSGEYLENAELEECECPCGSNLFEITAGVALYEGSEDVRWLYLGCRCPNCGLSGCYGDWKNEYPGYQGLLSRI